MSDQQIAEIYERLVAGKVPRPAVERVFQRGWNAGLDFAIKSLRAACDDSAEDPEAPKP